MSELIKNIKNGEYDAELMIIIVIIAAVSIIAVWAFVPLDSAELPGDESITIVETSDTIVMDLSSTGDVEKVEVIDPEDELITTIDMEKEYYELDKLDNITYGEYEVVNYETNKTIETFIVEDPDETPLKITVEDLQGEPIENATIQTGDDINQSTSKNGIVEIFEIDTSYDMMTVDADGFIEQTIELDIIEESDSNISIILTEDS